MRFGLSQKITARLAAFGAACAAALSISCGGEGSGIDGDTAVAVGRVEAGPVQFAAPGAGLPDRLTVLVNEEPREIVISRDGAFTIPDLPVGGVRIAVRTPGASGMVSLANVKPHEVIDLEIVFSPTHVAVTVVGREVPTVVRPPEPGSVTIDGKHVLYVFGPGTYRDVTVIGHHVTLLGAASACGGAGATVIAGTLAIRGHHVRVVNLDLRGDLRLEGHHVRFYDACRLTTAGHSDWSPDGWGDHGERDDDD